MSSTVPTSLKGRKELQQMPVKDYIDETVTPVLLQALADVSRVRPEDPVEHVAQYLLQHNPRRQDKPFSSTRQ